MNEYTPQRLAQIVAANDGDIMTFRGKERNEPCECGSGKKCKNCCRDRAAKQRDAIAKFRRIVALRQAQLDGGEDATV